jgi:hypothetical protein
VTALTLTGLISCGREPVACAGQCAPPYELEVDFHPGTSPAEAEKILETCTDHNPVVIRIGALHDLANGYSKALIYTHVFGKTARTRGLLRCLASEGVALAGWPD